MAGCLSDRFGRKGMLLGGLALFGTASAAGGLMTSSGGLIAARAVMGLGAAMVFPATLSLISNVFVERTERARAIGLWGATAGIAIALGPIAGGWLLERFSWSSIFFAMTPVAAVAAVLVARTVPTSRDESAPKLDRPGFVLSSAAMAVLIYTIIEAPLHGWSSARTLVGFGLGAVLLAGFVARERSTEEPMLDVRLFANPRFTAASASVTVAFFSLFGFIFLMTQYFQFIKNYGPLSAGVHLLPVATSVGVASVLGTRLAVRFGTKVVVAVGLVMVAAFYAWVAAVVSPGTAYGTIAVQMVLYGVGMGLTSAPATEAIMGVVPAGQGRRRLGGQRHDPPARRHAGRRRDRQRLRLALRDAPHRTPARAAARRACAGRSQLGRRGAGCGPWPRRHGSSGTRGRRRPRRLRRLHRRALARLRGRGRRRGSRSGDGRAAAARVPHGRGGGARARRRRTCAGARPGRGCRGELGLATCGSRAATA